MTPPDLIDRLAQHQTLSTAPRSELEWLASHGSLLHLNSGDVLSSKGVQVAGLYILLSGRLALFIDRGAGPNKFVEWHPGDVTGMMPYSRLTAPPGDVIALEPVEILTVPRELLKDLARACFEITTSLVHSMLDRARLFTSSELQNEKMISLGKLSAGLAHELNNPASAIERCASNLEDRIADSEAATRELAAANLSEAQLATLDAVRSSSSISSHHPQVRSPLDQMDREESIVDWLCSHSLDTTPAATLADSDITLQALDQLAATIQPPALNAAVHSIASGSAVRSLSAMIQECAMRISGLVTAVKGFTHMDQANTAEPVDLGPSLSSTVTVLNAKAREKSVNVTLTLEPDLPRVRGFAGELNQIWGNLIDNALDAVTKVET